MKSRLDSLSVLKLIFYSYRKLKNVECRTCNYTGHVSRDCPDTWRRYHATCNGSGEVVNPGKVEKPDRDCWCSNCGKKGHSVEHCNRYRFSKYPPTTLRVISYKQNKINFDSETLKPSAAALEEEESLNKPKKKKKKSKSCPGTPDLRIPDDFMSEPSSPVTRKSAFPTTLLVDKAIKKLDKKKDKKFDKKQKLSGEVVKLMNVGKNKKQILAEILSNDYMEDDDERNFKGKKNKHLKAKRIKTAISQCISAKKAEMRQKEWRDSRGFGQAQGQGSPRKVKKQDNSFQGSRANLIPSDTRAAAKFLKKEIQKSNNEASDKDSFSFHKKRIVKDINQEVFGLKNNHCPGSLKKVERKRLADLVLQLRAS